MPISHPSCVQVIDLRQNVARTAYGGMPFESLRAGVLPSFLEVRDRACAPKCDGNLRLVSVHTLACGWVQGFNTVLGREGRTWLAGSSLTIADFTLWEVLDQVRVMVAELADGAKVLEPYPALSAYMARFEALPAIAAYHASAAFAPRPFNNKIAVFK